MGSLNRRRNADTILSYSDAERIRDRYSRVAGSWLYRWMGINATGLQKDIDGSWFVVIIVERRVQALIAAMVARRHITGAPFEIEMHGPAQLL